MYEALFLHLYTSLGWFFSPSSLFPQITFKLSSCDTHIPYTESQLLFWNDQQIYTQTNKKNVVVSWFEHLSYA